MYRYLKSVSLVGSLERTEMEIQCGMTTLAILILKVHSLIALQSK